MKSNQVLHGGFDPCQNGTNLPALKDTGSALFSMPDPLCHFTVAKQQQHPPETLFPRRLHLSRRGKWQTLLLRIQKFTAAIKSTTLLLIKPSKMDSKETQKTTSAAINSPLHVQIPTSNNHGQVSWSQFKGYAEINLPPMTTSLSSLTSNLSSPSPSRSHSLPRLGPYVIEKSLGYGTFSKVKLGHHLSHSYPKVALKMVSLTDLKENKELRKSFFIELQIIRNCHHPHMIKLYTVLLSKHYCTLVLEYPSDEPSKGALADSTPYLDLPLTFRDPGSVIELYEWLEATSSGNGLSATIVKKLFHQLVDVMDYLHSRGIVHRDIKPENILILNSPSKGLVLKLIDFGLATMIIPESLPSDVAPSSSSNTTAMSNVSSPLIYASNELIEKGPWFGDYIYFETLITTSSTTQSSMARRLSIGAGNMEQPARELFPSTFPRSPGNGTGKHETSWSLIHPEGPQKIQYCHSHDLSFESTKDSVSEASLVEVEPSLESMIGSSSLELPISGLDGTTPNMSLTNSCASTPRSTASSSIQNIFLKTRCGSEEYAPPELLIGKPYQGFLSDIWSMGVLLFVMYYGVLPFGGGSGTSPASKKDGTSNSTLYKQICSGIIKWPKEKYGKNNTQERAFRELLKNMLKVIPEERWSLPQIRASSWFNLV